jgi:hypothetical protein
LIYDDLWNEADSVMLSSNKFSNDEIFTDVEALEIRKKINNRCTGLWFANHFAADDRLFGIESDLNKVCDIRDASLPMFKFMTQVWMMVNLHISRNSDNFHI